MDFEYSEKVQALIATLETFMDEHVYPIEQEFRMWTSEEANRWKVWPGLAALKKKARALGLWNLF